MRYFDLHCDTMTECAVKDIPLRKNHLHVNLESVNTWEHYVQCYAVWLPDDLRGEDAWQRFCKYPNVSWMKQRRIRIVSHSFVPLVI